MDSTNAILIVDDETSITELFAEFLPLQGYDVVVAQSGEEAVEISTARSFLLAFVDYSLPGINGLETSKYLKYNEKAKYIILMTGWAEIEEANDTEYIEQILAKPFDLMTILSLVQGYLSREYSK